MGLENVVRPKTQEQGKKGEVSLSGQTIPPVQSSTPVKQLVDLINSNKSALLPDPSKDANVQENYRKKEEINKIFKQASQIIKEANLSLDDLSKIAGKIDKYVPNDSASKRIVKGAIELAVIEKEAAIEDSKFEEKLAAQELQVSKRVNGLVSELSHLIKSSELNPAKVVNAIEKADLGIDTYRAEDKIKESFPDGSSYGNNRDKVLSIITEYISGKLMEGYKPS